MPYRRKRNLPRYQPPTYMLWLSPLLYMVVVGLYFLARYSGYWAEADSATFTKIIRAFSAQEKLIPAWGPTYPNGYSFQAISSFIIAVTGLDVVTLQQLVYPLVAALVVLPAWILFRELTGTSSGAAITTILLFTQPEFLFVVLRSSHEKFTRSLLLLSLFFLTRSLKLHDQPRLAAPYVVLFYLCVLTFITSNNLLAHSFVFAVVIALVLGRLLGRRLGFHKQETGRMLERLQSVTLLSLGLVYLVTFYVYPPAQHDLLVLEGIWERIAALFLDVQRTGGEGSTNAYAAVQVGWLNLYVYFLVSIANWIVLAASFAIWAYQGLLWLLQRTAPETESDQLLWLLYAAFAAQGALSAVSDASGALGSNLQHRLFPSFSIVAVAVVGKALARWRPRRFMPAIRMGLAVGLFWIAILSVFKATNEPMLSNKWTFYRPAELTAIEWTDSHLKGAEIWTEYDERLTVANDNARGESANQNQFQGYGVQPTTRNMLLTTITRLRSSRLSRPLPVPPDALRVYDNGEAELYHLRPETPYQK